MNTGALTTAASAAIAAGAIGAASKLTDNPIGCKGSLAHIATNEKLDAKDKVKTVAQITGQQLKDTVTIAGVTSVAGGAAAVAAKSSNKFVDYLKNVKHQAGEALSNITIKGKDLKSTIKDSNLYKKIDSLPKPAKAAIMVGSAVLATMSSFGKLKSAGDAGYIEAKNEKEIVKV